MQAARTDGYPADCSETPGLAEGDTPDSAGPIQAGSAAIGWAQVCCSADLAQADYWVPLTADGHSAPAVQMDDWLRAADDSPADLAADGYRVDSALDDCSLAVDCRAVADSHQDYSCRAARSVDSLRADFQDDFLLAAMAPVLQVEQ